MKEDVKEKIKAQAKKSTVFTSQSILLITVFAPLINDSFCRTHIHTTEYYRSITTGLPIELFVAGG